MWRLRNVGSLPCSRGEGGGEAKCTTGVSEVWGGGGGGGTDVSVVVVVVAFDEGAFAGGFVGVRVSGR